MMKEKSIKAIIISTILFCSLISCGNTTDSNIEKLDSLCDDYVECLRKGRSHDAEMVKRKMGKYWDKMNDLNRDNQLSDKQKEKLDEIETRMFDAEFESNR